MQHFQYVKDYFIHKNEKKKNPHLPVGRTFPTGVGDGEAQHTVAANNQSI